MNKLFLGWYQAADIRQFLYTLLRVVYLLMIWWKMNSVDATGIFEMVIWTGAWAGLACE